MAATIRLLVLLQVFSVALTEHECVSGGCPFKSNLLLQTRVAPNRNVFDFDPVLEADRMQQEAELSEAVNTKHLEPKAEVLEAANLTYPVPEAELHEAANITYPEPEVELLETVNTTPSEPEAKLLALVQLEKEAKLHRAELLDFLTAGRAGLR
mmetsp:Transcript_36616/g.80224  ORF Transcript_36616/g.80224 Transcript_36616/m.80224 type:complete len:154 (-) Transcript_36616:129-590(-)